MVRRTTPGRLVALVEVLAVGAVVLADVLIPSLVVGLLAAGSLLIRRDRLPTLGLARVRHPWRLAREMLLWAIGLALLDVGVLMPLAHHVTGQEQDTSDFAALQGNLAMLAVFLVLGWTLAAFAEELAFRGYLFTRLTDVTGSSRWSVAVALLLSSALFGVLHTEQGLVGVLVAGVDGLVFGALRVARGTLWAPILAHGLDNSIGFVAFFLVGPIPVLW